jgi:1,4-dihydroxy-6-naphthoate synthase
MKLSLAISPCPNDTFLFEPLLSGRIDTEGMQFELQFADIAELNNLARHGATDVVKLSFFTYAMVREQYALLNTGAALGRGCGPLLVSREPLAREDLAQARIAIPGVDTTAHLLLECYAPDAVRREVRVFHEIMPALLNGEFDAGVIIHESRFTYAQLGLHLIQDLGNYWEQTTGLPIPLGAIAAKHSLGREVISALNRVIRRSAEFALANPDLPMPFVRAHAQEMDEAVMRAHISLYVNEFSVDLGHKGHRAVTALLERADHMIELAR